MDIATGENSLTFLQMTIFSLTVIVVFALTQIASSVLEGYSYSKTEKGLRVYLIEQIIKKHLLRTGNYDNIIFGSCAAVAELADALDSKSSGKPCRFESGQRHLKSPEFFRAFSFCENSRRITECMGVIILLPGFLSKNVL